jgi:hypothetical protein
VLLVAKRNVCPQVAGGSGTWRGFPSVLLPIRDVDMDLPIGGNFNKDEARLRFALWGCVRRPFVPLLLSLSLRSPQVSRLIMHADRHRRLQHSYTVLDIVLDSPITYAP